MKIDKNRLKRQQHCIDLWSQAGRKGTLEAVTGFGKTYVALLILQEMNTDAPEATALIIVPTQNLKKQWEESIENLHIVNSRVAVINSAVKRSHTYDLLILDEIHNYTSSVFKTIFECTTYRYILGLTATLERDDARHYIIEAYAPVIDTISLKDAVKNSYVSPFKVFNLGLRMSESEEKLYTNITDSYYKHFALFNCRFHIAMKCLTDPMYRATYVRTLAGWEDYQVLNAARGFNAAMQKRKQLIYKSETKKQAAKEIIDLFDVPTITFSESVDFVKDLNKETHPWGEAYHSKMSKYARQNVLDRFSDDRTDTRVIHTARALDEGFDVEGIELAIICSGTSTARQDLQRTGRAIRFKEGKTGTIVNLYLKDTQDEKWLKKRQSKSTNIQWIHNVQELQDKSSISVYRDPVTYNNI